MSTTATHIKPVRTICALAAGDERRIRAALGKLIFSLPKSTHHYRMHGQGLRQLLGAMPRPFLEKMIAALS